MRPHNDTGPSLKHFCGVHSNQQLEGILNTCVMVYKAIKALKTEK